MQLKYKSIFYFYKIKCTYYAFLLENIFLTKKKRRTIAGPSFVFD